MIQVVKRMGLIQGASGGHAQRLLDCGPLVNAELAKFPHELCKGSRVAQGGLAPAVS